MRRLSRSRNFFSQREVTPDAARVRSPLIMRFVPAEATSIPASASVRFRSWLPEVAAFLLTLAAFLPVLRNGLVNWDDFDLIVDNPRIRALTVANLRWMFTTTKLGHYSPLSWLSFAFDHALWGLRPAGYHLTAILLHALNAALVCRLARRLLVPETGGGPPGTPLAGLLCALFFSLHPLRVETVAWATERRGLLCALFLLASTLSHLAGPAARGRRDLFALLAALSKGYVAPFPIVLLLLDYHPLQRFTRDRDSLRAALRDKWRLFAIAVSSAALSVYAARAAGIMQRHDILGLLERSALAARNLLFYLGKALAPVGLSPLYELRDTRFTPLSAAAILAVAGLSVAAVLAARSCPALTLAWFVQLLFLAPFLGFFQSGPQATADRYTYLAHIPLVFLVGGVLVRIRPGISLRLSLAATAVILATLASLSVRQMAVWQDSYTLWDQAQRVDPGSKRIRNYRLTAEARDRQAGELAALESTESKRALTAAERARLGELRFFFNRTDEALADLDLAITLDPARAESYALRCSIRIHADPPREPTAALADIGRAIQIAPDRLDWRRERITVALSTGDSATALLDLDVVIAADPADWISRANAALALLRLGRSVEAIVQYDAAIAHAPSAFQPQLVALRTEALRAAAAQPPVKRSGTER